MRVQAPSKSSMALNPLAKPFSPPPPTLNTCDFGALPPLPLCTALASQDSQDSSTTPASSTPASFKRVPSSLTAAIIASRTSSPGVPAVGAPSLQGGSAQTDATVSEESGGSVAGDSDCPSVTEDMSEELRSSRRNRPLPIETAQKILSEAIHEIEIDKAKIVEQSSSPCGLAMIPPNINTGKLGLGDFELLKIVGQGAFGKVFQVRYIRTNEILAMKVMRKEVIIRKDHSEYVRSERDLLTAVDHPYIVTMRFSFQTPQKLYLVLDFIQGGHLFFNLYREGVFSEDVARLYTAEIVSAISYLHGLGIMHRDLKPENCLITTDGHLKITDFGLAKGNVHDEDERSNSFIGTMEYMAPEIVDGKGHTKSVDWWSTGILLFEMLCGVPPFKAKSRNALQTQILNAKPKFPKFMGTDAQNLLKGLLTKDPMKRLGSGPGGSDAIKKHPFFKSINWFKLEKGEIPSTFKPSIQSRASVENFDKIWTDQRVEDSPCGTPKMSALVSDPTAIFQGFTFTSPSYLLSMNPAVFSPVLQDSNQEKRE